MLTSGEVESLNQQFRSTGTEEVLGWAWDRFAERAAIGTSFQGAGLVMLHLARTHGLQFPVFTLDTGLLFPETLELKRQLEDFFGCRIDTLTPDFTIEQQAQIHGPELWLRDPDLCCTLRKVLPLRDRLAQLDCWITGLRRDHSAVRSATDVVELYAAEDATGGAIVKLNPMARWSREAVWAYLREQRIPYNPLHDRGYRSIGCQPCTRPAASGDDERAGRWTGFAKTECGIHTFMARKA
jgi:phosphoadenosine phosphosulfate reductase